jgi:hypothetical protein
MRPARVALVAGIALVVPVPFWGSGSIQERPGSGCTTKEWEGLAPLPLAAYEAIKNRPPPYAYYEERSSICI